MVRDKRLAVTRPISKPLRAEYDHRCLYRSLRYLSLHPPVSCSFEGKDYARRTLTVDDFQQQTRFHFVSA
jgi:hypothetical protein